MTYTRTLPKLVAYQTSKRVYIFGGATNKSENKLIEVYNTINDNFKLMNTKMPEPFSNVFSHAVLVPAFTATTALLSTYENDMHASGVDDRIMIISFGAVSRSAPRMYMLNASSSKITEIDYDRDGSEF